MRLVKRPSLESGSPKRPSLEEEGSSKRPSLEGKGSSTRRNLKRAASFTLPKLKKGESLNSLTSLHSSLNSISSSSSEYTLTLEKPETFRKSCCGVEEVGCLKKLRAFCLDSNRFVSNHLLVRYAVYYNFNFEKAKAAITKGYTYSYLYLELEADLLRFIMRNKVFFPLPGLKSKNTGSDVFYMRPSRYEPSALNNSCLLDNLCYVLNDMSRTVEQCRNGVVMLVNMDGYTMKNFHGETQLKMARITEGLVVPTRLVEILIVNPPKFFSRLWKMVKPAFSSSLRRRIKIISDDKLGNFLMDGYEKYFPDEFLNGLVRTSEIVDDFIDLKLYEEEQRALGCESIMDTIPDEEIAVE